MKRFVYLFKNKYIHILYHQFVIESRCSTCISHVNWHVFYKKNSKSRKQSATESRAIEIRIRNRMGVRGRENSSTTNECHTQIRRKRDFMVNSEQQSETKSKHPFAFIMLFDINMEQIYEQLFLRNLCIQEIQNTCSHTQQVSSCNFS